MNGRSWWIVSVALAALADACEKEEPPPPPPPEGVAAAVLVRDVPVHDEAIGRTRGSSAIEIRGRVEVLAGTPEPYPLP